MKTIRGLTVIYLLFCGGKTRLKRREQIRWTDHIRELKTDQGTRKGQKKSGRGDEGVSHGRP